MTAPRTEQHAAEPSFITSAKRPAVKPRGKASSKKARGDVHRAALTGPAAALPVTTPLPPAEGDSDLDEAHDDCENVCPEIAAAEDPARVDAVPPPPFSSAPAAAAHADAPPPGVALKDRGDAAAGAAPPAAAAAPPGALQRLAATLGALVAPVSHLLHLPNSYASSVPAQAAPALVEEAPAQCSAAVQEPSQQQPQQQQQQEPHEPGVVAAVQEGLSRIRAYAAAGHPGRGGSRSSTPGPADAGAGSWTVGGTAGGTAASVPSGGGHSDSLGAQVFSPAPGCAPHSTPTVSTGRQAVSSAPAAAAAPSMQGGEQEEEEEDVAGSPHGDKNEQCSAGGGVGRDAGGAECLEEEDEEEEGGEEDFDPLLFIKSLPPLEACAPPHRAMLLPPKTRSCRRKTLVLDLDETLVHSTLEHAAPSDFTFPVTFNSEQHTVYVRQRPHMKEFMQRVAVLFEVVVFTASQKVYAEQLLNILDPGRRLVRHRVFRDSCVEIGGNYLKDLSVLGRDLSCTLIVDNSPQAFGFQIDNGVPIKSWYDDDADDELLRLLPFLESLVDVDDVRPHIQQRFGLKEAVLLA